MEVGDDGPAVGTRVRVAVYAFLLVFAVTGFATLEVFPFSGFRLFSELRSSQRESWQLRAVDASGAETPIRLGELPVAYRNTTTLLLSFDDLTVGERDEVCDAWATPLREAGGEVVGVRVYAVVDEVRPDDRPPRRTLAYECGGRA
jgi:hypothetical protein